MDALAQRLAEVQTQGVAICAALAAELRKVGFSDWEALTPAFAQAQFELSRDPYSGDHSLVGVWRGLVGDKRGSLLFHPDGTFYAEYDVIRPHPTAPHCFVEAVTAWGSAHAIKTEARLLPAP